MAREEACSELMVLVVTDVMPILVANLIEAGLILQYHWCMVLSQFFFDASFVKSFWLVFHWCLSAKKPCFQENLLKSFISAMVLCLPGHTLGGDFLL